MPEHKSRVPAFLAAAGRVDITPEMPLPLAGFTVRQGPASGADSRLEVNGLMLDDGSTRIVWISADLLFIGSHLHDRVVAEAAIEANREHLLMAATHTHFAPMTLQGMPEVGMVDEGYLGSVAGKIASLVRQLRGQLRPAHATLMQGECRLAINRRLARWRLGRAGIHYSTAMAPNPSGDRDPGLRVLRVTSEGRELAVVWNWACHPTAYPARARVSAEYPGVVRQAVRARSGDSPSVLFFQGLTGDARPPFASVRSGKELVLKCLRGPAFTDPTPAEWESWSRQIAERVLAVASSDPVALDGPISCTASAVPFDGFARNAGAAVLQLQSISVGSGLRVIALSAEPVAAWRHIIREVFPERCLMTLGYTGQVPGYLPVDKMLPEGGYEVEGFRRAFRFSGTYVPGIDSHVRHELIQLASIPGLAGAGAAKA